MIKQCFLNDQSENESYNECYLRDDFWHIRLSKKRQLSRRNALHNDGEMPRLKAYLLFLAQLFIHNKFANQG